MGKQRYAVDWTDPAFPEVRMAEYVPYAEGGSLAEAKREIIEHFTELIEHARGVIRDTRQLTRQSIPGRDRSE